jgi:putative hydrolase of the HAD superfamily
MNKTYKHIFFDLDHTLWDFETNSKLALERIYEEEKLGEKGVPSFEIFHKRYIPINDKHWAHYHNRIITKEQLRIGRFSATLSEWGIKDDETLSRIANSYTTISPKMTALFPNTLEVLKYLQAKYSLHLITNGFAEVQGIKIEGSGLKPFFKNIIISEEVGTQKPEKEIFEVAMNRAFTHAEECLMVGDNYTTDIAGARRAGIDQVFFNPKRTRRKVQVTYEIGSLIELKGIL